jgi:hypothetical protein
MYVEIRLSAAHRLKQCTQRLLRHPEGTGIYAQSAPGVGTKPSMCHTAVQFGRVKQIWNYFMFINLGLLYMFVGLTHLHFWWHCIFKALVLFQMAYLEGRWDHGTRAVRHNKIDDIIVLKMNLMMSCLAHWPNSSRWAIILEFRLVESIKQNAVPHSC